MYYELKSINQVLTRRSEHQLKQEGVMIYNLYIYIIQFILYTLYMHT